MIGETTDVPSRLRYLRHRSSARCPCLMINKTGQSGSSSLRAVTWPDLQGGLSVSDGSTTLEGCAALSPLS